jgi:hypothetical protein
MEEKERVEEENNVNVYALEWRAKGNMLWHFDDTF